MKRGQFDGIIQHMERDLGGQGYEIEIRTAECRYRGALLPKIPGREDVVAMTLDVNYNNVPREDYSASDDLRALFTYLDVEAIVSVRGPIL